MSKQNTNDARANRQISMHVEEGLRLSHTNGIHPALLFMEQVGVPRLVALRVLCSPDFFRHYDRRQRPRPSR
jgi:hypothetical protein